MKALRPLVNLHRMRPAWAGWLLALFAAAVSAHAVTLYPAADTYSTLDYSAGKNPAVTKRFITKAAGVTGSLYVSRSHAAFIEFNAAAQLSGTTVTGARLTLYFPSVIKPGNLDVCVVSSAWTETFKASMAPEPSYGASFGQIPAANVLAKQFVVIDVTPEVQAWVSGATPDNGFAVQSLNGLANVLLGAKEGPGSGYPATLEVDSQEASASTFIGNVGIGTASPDDRFPLTIQGQPVSQSGNSTLLIMADGNGNERWHMQLEGASGNLGFTETDVADNRFVLATGGNVGIGTGSPSALLEVNGSALVDGPMTAASFSGDGSALTNVNGANIAAATVGNAPLGLCKISGFVGSCGNSDPTHTFVYVRGTSSLAYVGDSGANGYPYQITLMEPGAYTLVARASNGTETSTKVTVTAGQTLAGVNFNSPTTMTDANNCGGCGVACQTGTNCVGGKCQ